MKTYREEKLESKLSSVKAEMKNLRKELHTTKQKNRDLEKSRTSYKGKLKLQKEENLN